MHTTLSVFSLGGLFILIFFQEQLCPLTNGQVKDCQSQETALTTYSVLNLIQAEGL